MNRTGFDPVEFLLSLSRSEYIGMKPGLERIRELLWKLGSPETSFNSVLIGGTNGKGSTAVTLASLLHRIQLPGGKRLRWGLFLSPHLINLEERIVVMGQPAKRDRIREIAGRLIGEREGEKDRDRWTFFEFITAIAFAYFREEQVELAVVEVGLGGRLDATNTLKPLVSVITNVCREHTEWLGDTVAEIAREKAGIIKEGGIVITGAEGEAREEIEQIAKTRRSQVRVRGVDFQLGREPGNGFTYQGVKLRIEGLDLKAPGRFQEENAALALATLEALAEKIGWDVKEAEIRSGLRGYMIPGRFQVIDRGFPLILDGAHNPAAARQLAEEMEKSYPGWKVRLIFSAMRDKEVNQVLRPLLPLVSRIFLVDLGGERAISSSGLEKILRDEGSSLSLESPGDVGGAINKAGEGISERELVLISGSLYLVGAALRALGLKGWVQITSDGGERVRDGSGL